MQTRPVLGFALRRRFLSPGLLALLGLAVAGCHGGAEQGGADMAAGGPSGGGITLPLLTPPVRAATPAGLAPTTQASKLRPLVLAASDFKSRFFDAGPTNLFTILGAIDDRIAGLNSMSAAGAASCFSAAPVAYTIAPFGQTITMYAQCYDLVGSAQPEDAGLLQVGQKDGVTYLYQAIGQGQIAAVVTPVEADGGDPGEQVEAWISVGTLNAATSCGGHAEWDGCSYGVIHLWADSGSKRFEMTVAGIGFGYCGAQLKSDGTTIYAVGSTDMGATCNVSDTLCVAAADATSAASCDAIGAFALAGLGRAAVAGTHQSWAASQFPAAVAGSGNVTLDGSATDAAHFGPTAPSAGVDRLR